MLRFLVPAGLLIGCAVAAGQDRPLYERFLWHVARAPVHTDGQVLLNGQPVAMRAQSVSEHLGLTDGETRVLREIASEYLESAVGWDATEKPLVLAVRLAKIEERQPDESVAQRLEAVRRERRAVTGKLVERLRYELGEARFDALDAFVRSRRDAFSMAPPPVSVEP